MPSRAVSATSGSSAAAASVTRPRLSSRCPSAAIAYAATASACIRSVVSNAAVSAVRVSASRPRCASTSACVAMLNESSPIWPVCSASASDSAAPATAWLQRPRRRSRCARAASG